MSKEAMVSINIADKLIKCLENKYPDFWKSLGEQRQDDLFADFEIIVDTNLKVIKNNG